MAGGVQPRPRAAAEGERRSAAQRGGKDRFRNLEREVGLAPFTYWARAAVNSEHCLSRGYLALA